MSRIRDIVTMCLKLRLNVTCDVAGGKSAPGPGCLCPSTRAGHVSTLARSRDHRHVAGECCPARPVRVARRVFVQNVVSVSTQRLRHTKLGLCFELWGFFAS